MTIAVDMGRKATKTNKKTNRLCGSLGHPWLLAYAISTIISRLLGCSLLLRMFKVKVNSTISVLFVCLI